MDEVKKQLNREVNEPSSSSPMQRHGNTSLHDSQKAFPSGKSPFQGLAASTADNQIDPNHGKSGDDNKALMPDTSGPRSHGDIREPAEGSALDLAHPTAPFAGSKAPLEQPPSQSRLERQLTPGAADTDGPDRRSRIIATDGAAPRRRASDPLVDHDGLLQRRATADAKSGELRAKSQDDEDDKEEDLQELNREQALNLTDNDVESLKELLIKNVSS